MAFYAQTSARTATVNGQHAPAQAASNQIYGARDAIRDAQSELEQLLNGVASDGRAQNARENGRASQNNIALAAGQVNGYAPEMEEIPLCYVMALYAYQGDAPNHVSMQQDDILVVYSQQSSGWWDGILIQSVLPDCGNRGWFPSSGCSSMRDVWRI